MPKETRTKVVPAMEVAAEDMGFYGHWLASGEEDRRALRWALGSAVIFHLALFGVHLPRVEASPVFEETRLHIRLAPPPRFRPPDPSRPPEVKQMVRKVPIPDPEPEAPEPIRLENADVPLVFYVDPDVIIETPEAPPPSRVQGPMEIKGAVQPPVKVFAPQPSYPEIARKIRRQGTVQLRAIIDRHGGVSDIQVVTPAPYGLTEAAVEAVQQWRFRPATLGGEPVAVFLDLQVRFSLQ